MCRCWRSSIALVAALALAGAAQAFNPDPRPVPVGVTGVCSDSLASPTPTACESDFECTAPALCVANPATVVAGIVVRGVLTLITDEDVTGWNGGADSSAERAQNARLTVVLEYTKDGAPRVFAETYRLEAGDGGTCDSEGQPALCVPQPVTGWQQPASEETLIFAPGDGQDLNLVWTIPGAEIGKAVARDLTGDAASSATPFLEVVDSADQFDHRGSDPLASVRRLKVTIRLRP